MSSGMVLVLVIVAIVTVGRVVRTAINARHGLPDGRSRGRRGRDGDEVQRQNALLMRENEALRGTLGRMEDRLSVLERIATDAPARLAAEIEKLR